MLQLPDLQRGKGEEKMGRRTGDYEPDIGRDFWTLLNSKWNRKQGACHVNTK